MTGYIPNVINISLSSKFKSHLWVRLQCVIVVDSRPSFSLLSFPSNLYLANFHTLTSIPLSPFSHSRSRQDKTTGIGKTTRYYWYRSTRTGPPRSPRTPHRQFHPPDCSHPIPGRSPCPQPSLRRSRRPPNASR